MASLPPTAPYIPDTLDEELLCCLAPGYPDFTAHVPERVARIGDEVAYGFTPMAEVAQTVSIFGSARTPPGHLHYILARVVATRLGA